MGIATKMAKIKVSLAKIGAQMAKIEVHIKANMLKIKIVMVDMEVEIINGVLPFDSKPLPSTFGWKHATLSIKCCHKAIFARFWNL